MYSNPVPRGQECGSSRTSIYFIPVSLTNPAMVMREGKSIPVRIHTQRALFGSLWLDFASFQSSAEEHRGADDPRRAGSRITGEVYRGAIEAV
jgi:hypothetical protein